MNSLGPRLLDLARASSLLVATDFDGVLAPIVTRPDLARPLPLAVEALVRLAALPGTTVAIISGRARDDLRARLGEPPGVILVGSHGAEEGGDAVPNDTARAGVEAALREAHGLAARFPGAHVEEKPVSVALHYRAVAPADAPRLVEETHRVFTSIPGGWTLHGKKVVEVLFSAANKARAFAHLRGIARPSGMIFLGDDETDECVFLSMREEGVAVKVGEGESAAPLRLRGPTEAARAMVRLAAARARLAAGPWPLIDSLAFLSDQRTGALIDASGRLVWMCSPRLDSPSVFGELLGDGGSFDVEPATPAPGDAPMQRYLGDTFILETTRPGLTVTDYLDCSAGRPFQRAGRTDLIRVVQAARGARIRFAPRLDFGRQGAALEARPGGLHVRGGTDPIALVSPGVAWRIEREGPHEVAHAEIAPGGAPVTLELRFGSASVAPEPLDEAKRREQTARFWSAWAASLRLPPVAPALVKRSALTLKALVYGPSGALAAAGTTSLPETLGGVRNWDYRFCWPRDAAVAAASLVRVGNTGVALRYLDWLLGVLDQCESPDRLRPIYTVAGRHLPPEGEVSELPGYAGSKPVRISNAAALQAQLDVFGPIADLLAMLGETGAALGPEHWRLARAMVGAVEVRWREPDAGIWEVRTAPRRHTHSRVMCWLAVDRAIAVAERVIGERPPEWPALRDAIRDDILATCWAESIGAFGAADDLPEPDAATLITGLSGMLAPDDERFLRTIDVVQRALRDGPATLRYRYDDGLPGREGGFHLCTGWLTQSLLLTGRRDEARALFEEMADSASPLGLLPEQVDGPTGLGLGNHPQAYSHAAIIDSAVALAEAGETL